MKAAAASPAVTSRSAAAVKERLLGRRLRLHVVISAAAGSAMSVVSAVLIAYAILDIERARWAQWLYTVVYASSAVVFGSIAGIEFMPDAVVRYTVVTLCALTAGLSYKAPALVALPPPARVLGLTLLGTGLGASLLLSSLVIMRVALEMRGVLPPGGAVEEGPLNGKQLLLLGLCALLEGAYFGLAVGLLDQGRPSSLVALPHEAPAVVYPAAAVLGAACGGAVERLRQRDDPAYVRGVELQILGGGSSARGGAGEQEGRALLGAACADDEDL